MWRPILPVTSLRKAMLQREKKEIPQFTQKKENEETP
jgi:hypothetical protein